ASYYHMEPDCLFMVRVVQGLVHMGKGTIALTPSFKTDRSCHKWLLLDFCGLHQCESL
ncbi:uncharacterized protein EI90DRAFT_3250989, partial [Cantharellus anzutake]|uniref:uncharacterized protein n=1 Tax=Cantharellus anzutake TaxID=1750568 RepID=UPI001904AE35